MSNQITPLDVLERAGYKINLDEAVREDGTQILDRGSAYIMQDNISAKEIADCIMQNMELEVEGWPDEFGDFVAYYGEDEDGTPLYFVIGQYDMDGDVYINLYAG